MFEGLSLIRLRSISSTLNPFYGTTAIASPIVLVMLLSADFEDCLNSVLLLNDYQLKCQCRGRDTSSVLPQYHWKKEDTVWQEQRQQVSAVPYLTVCRLVSRPGTQSIGSCEDVLLGQTGKRRATKNAEQTSSETNESDIKPRFAWKAGLKK